MIVLPLLAAVSLAGLAPADQDDLRCLAYLSRAEAHTDGALRMKVEAGALYYFGRIEARSPQLDIADALAGILASPTYTHEVYEADKARCHAQLDPLAADFDHWRDTYRHGG